MASDKFSRHWRRYYILFVCQYFFMKTNIVRGEGTVNILVEGGYKPTEFLFHSAPPS
jgi:hypothetical protein